MMVGVVSRLKIHFRRSVEAAASGRRGHPVRGSLGMIAVGALVAAYSLWQFVDASGWWDRTRIAVTFACALVVTVFQVAVRRQIRRNAQEA
jgi:hypothetical protein